MPQVVRYSVGVFGEFAHVAVVEHVDTGQRFFRLAKMFFEDGVDAGVVSRLWNS